MHELGIVIEIVKTVEDFVEKNQPVQGGHPGASDWQNGAGSTSATLSSATRPPSTVLLWKTPNLSLKRFQAKSL
jgi:hypothetical protein